jgi:hypothetical protein
METEALKEADSRRKNQRSRKAKRESTVVDLPFVLIIRTKKVQQEQDGCPCCRGSQNEKGQAERQNSARKTDGNNGEKRRKIEKQERNSTAVGQFISKGLRGHGDLHEDTPSVR